MRVSGSIIEAVGVLEALPGETVIDRATPKEPEALSTGISQVWVNGVTVFGNGATSGLHPGKMILRGGL